MSIPTDDELRKEALRLRIDKRLNYRDIAKELGVSLGKVSEYLKGVALPILKEKDIAREVPGDGEKSGLSVHNLISEVRMSKLYALALDEGFTDPNAWIDNILLPWYQIKRNFEWMFKMKINPVEFGAYIEATMIDSIELKQIKERLNKLSLPEGPPLLQTNQTSAAPAAPGGSK